MTDENYNPQEQDALTRRIVDRLAEREYKIQRMQELKQRKKPARKYAIGGALALAIAACIAAMFIFQPFAQVSPLESARIQEPTMSEFRGASEDIAEISALMKKPNYQLALIKTEKSLVHLEMQIDELKDVPVDDWGDEDEYEEQQEMLMASELRWTYIYLLVKQGDYKTAKKELKKYIKNKEYAEHMTEAQKLLKELQN